MRGRVRNLIDSGNITAAEVLKAEWHWLFPETVRAATASSSASSSVGVRDLELGMSGEDVRLLQLMLNAHGFVLAEEGAGSLGNETDYFGERTQTAVAAYQSANGVMPSVGYFGPLTRASMTMKGFSGLWW